MRLMLILALTTALPACARNVTRVESSVALAVAPDAVRTVETELEALARLERELALLEATIRDAEMTVQPARTRFDYDQLRLDIDRIRLGIRAYRTGELSQPRAIEPLTGDYRR